MATECFYPQRKQINHRHLKDSSMTYSQRVGSQMSTKNGGFKGGVRGCYDATPLEVDVHRLTIVCTSLLRSYTSLVIARTRPTLGQMLSIVLSNSRAGHFIYLITMTYSLNQTLRESVAPYAHHKKTELAPIINSGLMPPRGSVRIEGYITKIISDFRRSI